MTRLRRFAGGVWVRVERWFHRPYQTVVVEGTLPARLERRTIYIVREDRFDEEAAMLCPCGCRRVLHMNLLPDERPFWSLKQNRDGAASLYPSIWRTKDCGSHFWLRDGRIQWC